MLSMLTARVDLREEAGPPPVVLLTLLRTERSRGDSWVVVDDASDSRDPPLVENGRNRCLEQAPPEEPRGGGGWGGRGEVLSPLLPLLTLSPAVPTVLPPATAPVPGFRWCGGVLWPSSHPELRSVSDRQRRRYTSWTYIGMCLSE